MAAHSNGQAIRFYSCGYHLLSFFFFLFSSPILSRQRLDVNHISTHVVSLIANLECMSEMCCTRLAENTGRKNYAKNRHLRMHHRTTFSGYIFATKARIVNRKKLIKQQYLLRMSSHNMVNFSSLAADIDW